VTKQYKDDRFYWNGKQWVPSGTTVLPSPDLKRWAANCAVDYIIDTSNMTIARTAYQRESTEAADYGTYIHKLCEVSLTDDIKIESPHEMTQKFMDGLWAWKTKHRVKVIVMEHEVLHERYGGRLDLVCEMDGVVTLVDFKTSSGKGSYYATWKYQLAGYRNAYNGDVNLNAHDHALGVTLDGTDEFWDEVAKYTLKHSIQHHGILKFNKKTMKANYKDFTEYQATRTNPETLEKEKYTRNYETDLATFMACVRLWWAMKRGIEI